MNFPPSQTVHAENSAIFNCTATGTFLHPQPHTPWTCLCQTLKVPVPCYQHECHKWRNPYGQITFRAERPNSLIFPQRDTKGYCFSHLFSTFSKQRLKDSASLTLRKMTQRLSSSPLLGTNRKQVPRLTILTFLFVVYLTATSYFASSLFQLSCALQPSSNK